MRLENQTVIVTGGASGLGAAIVERFINEGANVGVLDRSEAGCAELREQYGEKIVCIAGDVRQFDDNEKIVTECVKTFGKLDCVIGNAGIWLKRKKKLLLKKRKRRKKKRKRRKKKRNRSDLIQSLIWVYATDYSFMERQHCFRCNCL